MRSCCVKQGAQPGALCVWMGWEACEGSSRGGDKCILMAVSHIVRQKPTQHCKAIIVHIKKKKNKKRERESVLAMWLLIIDNVISLPLSYLYLFFKSFVTLVR